MKRYLILLSIPAFLWSCHSKSNKGSNAEQAQADTSAHYHILKKIKVPGDGGWDYAAFDSMRRHLFLSHGTKVDIVDPDKEQVIGEIPNTPGVHGIAFAYDLERGYTSNGKDSSVTIFDLNTFKIINKVKITGANPDAIVYDRFSKRVFTFNGHSGNCTAINAETGNVEGTITLDGRPEFSLTNNAGHIFVNIEDKNEVQVINPKLLQVVNTWKLDSGQEPSAMAYDITYRRLFIGCGNGKLEILNGDNGVKAMDRNIGPGVDAAAFDVDNKNIFTSNGEGTLSVIRQTDGDHYSQAVNIPTQKGARTMAIDIKKDRIYLPVADFGPPAPAEPGKKQRPSIVPGSFCVLVVGKE